MEYVSRDSFARETLYKRRVYLDPLMRVNGEITYATSCAWCGSVRKTKKGKAYLYKYIVEPDAGRPVYIEKLFCCKSCMRDFSPFNY